MKMNVSKARTVLNTIHGGVLAPGSLWISGLLDDASEAAKVVRRANARNATRKKVKAKAEKRKAPKAKRKAP